MALKSVQLLANDTQLLKPRILALFTTFGGNKICARRSATKRPPIFFGDQVIDGQTEDMFGSDQLKKLASKGMWHLNFENKTFYRRFRKKGSSVKQSWLYLLGL